MKRVKIISNCLVPSKVAGVMKTAYIDSVLDLDDDVAGNLIAGQRARYVSEEEKLVDTTKEHEAAADKRASEVSSPETMFAAAVAAAVKTALDAKSSK